LLVTLHFCTKKCQRLSICTQGKLHLCEIIWLCSWPHSILMDAVCWLTMCPLQVLLHKLGNY